MALADVERKIVQAQQKAGDAAICFFIYQDARSSLVTLIETVDALQTSRLQFGDDDADLAADAMHLMCRLYTFFFNAWRRQLGLDDQDGSSRDFTTFINLRDNRNLIDTATRVVLRWLYDERDVEVVENLPSWPFIDQSQKAEKTITMRPLTRVNSARSRFYEMYINDMLCQLNVPGVSRKTIAEQPALVDLILRFVMQPSRIVDFATHERSIDYLFKRQQAEREEQREKARNELHAEALATNRVVDAFPRDLMTSSRQRSPGDIYKMIVAVPKLENEVAFFHTFDMREHRDVPLLGGGAPKIPAKGPICLLHVSINRGSCHQLLQALANLLNQLLERLDEDNRSVDYEFDKSCEKLEYLRLLRRKLMNAK